MKKFVLYLLLSALSFTASSQVAEEKIREMVSAFDVTPSLEKALILSPKNMQYVSYDEFSNQAPVNVVVLLHGCTGIKSEELTWARLLKDNGYYVVLLNSFAIKGRTQNCDPNTFAKDLNRVPAVPLKIVESLHAIAEIKKISSVQRVFLMGHSEGAAASTALPMSMVNGVIAMASFCNRTVGVDKNIPLLTINHRYDPFFNSPYLCKEKTVYRVNTTTEVLIDGNGHDTSYHRPARDAVLEFLKINS